MKGKTWACAWGEGNREATSLLPRVPFALSLAPFPPFPLPFEHLLRKWKGVFKEDLLLERIKDKYCWFARDVTVAMFVPGQEQSISLLREVNTILM